MDESMLQALGMSREEIQDRAIKHIADSLVEAVCYDEDEHECRKSSSFKVKLQDTVKKRIDTAVAEIAEKHVLPNATTYIENLCLQETNEWGEKKGAPLTFKEYLIARAENYLREQVDYEGKDKAQAGGYSWRGTQTRITHLVEKHLHYSIKTAIEEAMKNGLGTVARAIHETCRLKINEVAAGMTVEVKTK